MKNKLLSILLAIILTLTGINMVHAYSYDGYGYGNLASDYYSRSTKYYDAEVFSRSDGYGGRVTVQNEVKFEHNFKSQIDYPVYRNYDSYQYYRPYYSDSRSYSRDYPRYTNYDSYPTRNNRRMPMFFYDELN